MTVTQADIDALAERLADLELPDGQLEALRLLVAAAADEPEITGFMNQNDTLERNLNQNDTLERNLRHRGLDFSIIGAKVGAPRLP